MSYDSTVDTLQHIRLVRSFLHAAAVRLLARGHTHDDSKLREPEKPIFDEYTPKLRKTTYGSDEYQEYLEEMKVALEHHYLENSHHPEHYTDGINGMDLFDVLEMLCDWMAAVKRHDDGNIHDSLDINAERFDISPQLKQILRNTIYAMADEQ